MMYKALLFLLVAASAVFGSTHTVYTPSPFEVVNTPLYCNEAGIVKKYEVGEIVDGTKAINSCSKNIATVTEKAAVTKVNVDKAAKTAAEAKRLDDIETQGEKMLEPYFYIAMIVLIIAAGETGRKTKELTKKKREELVSLFLVIAIGYLVLTYFTTYRVVLLSLIGLFLLPYVYSVTSGVDKDQELTW